VWYTGIYWPISSTACAEKHVANYCYRLKYYKLLMVDSTVEDPCIDS
jgi:hypothetical protein